MKKAIFLDRDGTINIEKDYLYKIEDFEYEKGVCEALKILDELGYILIVVTNQSGVARGYYSEEDVQKLNSYIKEDLKKKGVSISKFYYCPHHPEGLGKYGISCECRKPSPKMLEDGILEFDIDRTTSFMVGDNISDIKAGINAGVQPILVKTGYGSKNIEKAQELGAKIFENLLDFAKYLKNS